MARIEYRRVDFSLRVEPGTDGGAVIHSGPVDQPALARTTALDAAWVALCKEAGGVPPDLPAALDLQSRLASLVSADVAAPLEGMAQLVPRITVDVRGPVELAALDWESVLEPLAVANGCAQVRVTPLKRRGAWIPLSLPLRLVHVTAPNSPPLGEQVRGVFGSQPEELVRRAFDYREVREGELADWQPNAEWPTADILHIDELPTLDEPSSALAWGAPDAFGSVGWLARFAHIWQTRLILIDAWTPEQHRVARAVAHALTARGGPAVVTGPLSGIRQEGFNTPGFYWNLVHDFALDAAFLDANWGAPLRATLFGGAGREEALRVSTVGIGLLDLGRDLAASSRSRTSREPAYQLPENVARIAMHELPMESRTRGRSIRSMVRRRSVDDTPLDRRNRFQGMAREARRLSEDWDAFEFEFHESDGLLPLAERLTLMRDLVGSEGPANRSEVVPSVRGRRFVNSAFYTEAAAEGLTLVPQEITALDVGSVYHLGVDIGPRRVDVRTVGAAAVIEEIFQWAPEKEGVWVEVAITGLDFQLVGHSVQELWLPKDAPSDPLYFAVIPGKRGVSRLRFCVYYRQQLVQSFRVAAATRSPGGRARRASARREALAKALDLPLGKVGDAGYMARLEYGSLGDPARMSELPGRDMSIVANHNDGKRVISVKASGVHAEIDSAGDVDEWVARVRNTLDAVTRRPVDDVPRDQWPYRFGLGPDRLNAAREADFKEVLPMLAEEGWELFDRLVYEDDRPQLMEMLEGEQKVIEVAHVLLEDVVPWAALYTTRYDPHRRTDGNGHAVAHDVCLACIPGAHGLLPATKCGERPECLLHEDTAKARSQAGLPAFRSDTVVCPLNFLGFRHVIELPPLQADRRGRTADRSGAVAAGATPLMGAGLNARLPRADDHRTELAALAQEPEVAARWSFVETERDRLLDSLTDPDLDVIYLYCHAEGGQIDGTRPRLVFQDLQDPEPRVVYPGALDHAEKWAHSPLVMLNGCGTAAFSPDALSPFIRKLVRGRGASGVIGTEIQVYEVLAGEVAREFLRRFLRGDPAGSALLMVRRGLLSQLNPLGLAFTLYGAAGLSLTRT